MFKRYLSYLFALTLSSSAFGSGTVIRDGGDPLFFFLEATRSIIVDTVTALRIPSNKPMLDKFCELPTLNQAQTEKCREFFIEVGPQLITLNTGTMQTLFTLKEEPILVTGPDGKEISVAAATELGPQGVIDFHRGSIQFMPPAELLFLMVHEFGHKVNFQGHPVSDNDLTPPFTNGRQLLDAMAAGILAVAKARGKVGAAYGLLDHFDCRMVANGVQFNMQQAPPRIFYSEDRTNYQTIIDGLGTPESHESQLVFRAVITEPTNCQPTAPGARKTELWIYRFTRATKPGDIDKEEILSQQTLLDYNPICEKNPAALSLAYDKLQASCLYIGTQGSSRLTKDQAK